MGAYSDHRSRIRAAFQRPLGKHAEARPADDAARRAWRSAPVFASGRRPAPQKSAKRKRAVGRPPPFRVAVPCFCCGRRPAPQKSAKRKRTVGRPPPFRVAVPCFCCGRRSALAKTDRCPCSASPVSAAGSGSAAQPPLGQRSVRRAKRPGQRCRLKPMTL